MSLQRSQETDTQLYGLLATDSASNAACQNVLGRNCEPNQANPVPSSTATFTQDSPVLDAFNSYISGASNVKPVRVKDVSATVPSGAGVGKI